MPTLDVDSLQLLTTAEVADLVHMSKSWVDKQRKIGAVDYLKLGRSVRYTLDHVAALQVKCRRTGRRRTLAPVVEMRRAS